MQTLDINIKAVTQGSEPLRFHLPSGSIYLPFRFPSRLQLSKDIRFSSLAGVKFKAKLTQTDFTQAPVHDIQGSNFLRYEQHPAPLSDGLGNHVGNRLALTRARWADENEVFALGRCHHRRKLR